MDELQAIKQQTEATIEAEERITEASMKLFFSEMISLEKFAYKLSNSGSDDTKLDYAGYAANDLPCHTVVMVGLVSSTTQLRKLMLRNVILLETAISQWPIGPLE